MTENQVLALKGRRLEITCLTGLVWITDGVSGDRVIQSGQQATLRSKSKICVQAFAPSVIRIRPPAPAASALIRNQNLNFEMGATQPPAEAL
jgi:ribosomal protein L19